MKTSVYQVLTRERVRWTFATRITCTSLELETEGTGQGRAVGGAGSRSIIPGLSTYTRKQARHSYRSTRAESAGGKH